MGVVHSEDSNFAEGLPDSDKTEDFNGETFWACDGSELSVMAPDQNIALWAAMLN